MRLHDAGSFGEVIDFVTAIERESGRFSELISRTELSRPVPSCPGWTMADLAWHLAEVQQFWAEIAGRLLDNPDRVRKIGRPADTGLPQLFREQSVRLAEALRTRSPQDACWSWDPSGGTVGWVQRRQAHEALIHRIDAELGAASKHIQIEAELAADGVDEIITLFLDASDLPAWAQFTPDGRTVAVKPSDGDSTWLMELGSFSGTSPSSGNTYDEEAVRLIESATPSAVITGTSAAIDRWLWGRGELDAVTVSGDSNAAAHVRAAAVHATQ